MPDCGHPLEFGTFITPSNNPATTPVALAQLSEQLGYDVVTFQDHPYQPAFLDRPLVSRRPPPVQIRYHLTERGADLIRSLQPLVKWGHRWQCRAQRAADTV